MLKNKGIKVGRNDPCPCGSGKKYKKCCLNAANPKPVDYKKLYADKYNIRLKSKKDVEQIRACGRLVLETLDLVEAAVAPGVTTEQINTIAHEHAVKNGAYPSPLNYRGFPKSVCTSVNEVICHGIPDNRRLAEGDIVNIDVTVFSEGVHGDTSVTFCVGEVDEDSRRLVRETRNAMNAGIAAVRPGAKVND